MINLTLSYKIYELVFIKFFILSICLTFYIFGIKFKFFYLLKTNLLLLTLLGEK